MHAFMTRFGSLLFSDAVQAIKIRVRVISEHLRQAVVEIKCVVCRYTVYYLRETVAQTAVRVFRRRGSLHILR